jgi:AAA15 family ATPase/GTPase
MLIRDLTIQGYRCFEDFSMDGLTRVNLLVGNNNSGKTSFLEAVYLLVNQPSGGTIYKAFKEILENRNEFVKSTEINNDESREIITRTYYLDRLFNGYDKNNSKHIYIRSTQDTSINTDITLSLQRDYISLRYPRDASMLSPDKETISFSLHSKELFEFSVVDFRKVPPDKINNRTDFSSLIKSSYFLSTYQKYFAKMKEVWDDINLSPKQKIVIEALRIILPEIEDFTFRASPSVHPIRLKIKDYSELIPLSSMGDGMNRILMLAMALVSTEKGVLLVDEIETGLHYEAQLDMWRLVLKTAQDLDVQVFATTHSWDCIAAFKEALQELEDQSVAKLFRLDSKYGKLRAVEYDAEEIRIAVNQGVEVR